MVERHAGTLPDDPAACAALPGVGRYTSGALASFAFDRPAAAVDANIARVLARLFALATPIDSTAGRAELWRFAELLLPPSGGRLHTSALMELGALVCRPRQPRCPECPARRFCAGSGAPEFFPVKKPPRATVALEENCAWTVRRGALLLASQTGSRWRGLWKLPPLAGPLPPTPPLFQTTYPFTHHRITLRVYPQPAPAATPLPPALRWIRLSDLPALAFPTPHRRAVNALLPK